MAKKSNLLIYGLIGLAGVGAYMYFKKRSSATESKEIETPESSEQTEPQKVATVTTAIENVSNGIEKATELLQTVKSGVVEVKDKAGKVRAIVKKKKKAKKVSKRKSKKQKLSQYINPEAKQGYEVARSVVPYLPKLAF